MEIRGLRVLGQHGVCPKEQARQQPFVLDISVSFDVSEAVRTDDLSATVDYAAVADQAKRIVERERHALLEKLAARICDEVLTNHRAREVTVRVAKPKAPLGVDVESVAVVVTRRQGE